MDVTRQSATATTQSNHILPHKKDQDHDEAPYSQREM
jgi:hypothetical protein